MRRRALHWPFAMVLLLAAVVVTNIRVAMIAADDPSFAIEPDYYRKAVAWDSAMAQAERNVALGWKVVPSLDAFTPDSGAALRVRLLDATGAPVSQAEISVTALHNARAADAHTLSMHADGDRGYVVTLPVDRAGQWELRFDVVRGADRYTTSTRIEAIPATGP